MRPVTCLRAALFTALVAACGGQTAAPSPAVSPTAAGGKVTIAEEKAALVIQVDGKPFTTYRFAPAADDPKWQRPYFWPAAVADGTVVTSDQMREFDKDPKADHPHQRSIWVGHGDVNGANHWTQSPEQQRHVRFEKVDADGFVELLTWDAKGENGAKNPVLTERRTVKVIAYADGSRGLEITSELTAPSADAVFKCKPLNVSGVEAGLCSVRVAKAITDGTADQKWISSGAPATGEAEARSKPATWCDYTGLIHGQKYGAAMVLAADNPGATAAGMPWHVRLFGLLADIGPLNWTLEKGKTATFRHLVILHPGDAQTAGVAAKAAAWRGK